MPDPKKGGEPVAGIPGTTGAEKAPLGVTPVLVKCAAVAGMVVAGWLIGSSVSPAYADLPEPRISAPHAALIGGGDLLDVEILPASETDTFADPPLDTPTTVEAAPELVPDLVAPNVASPAVQAVQAVQEPVVNEVEPVLTAVVEPVRKVVVVPVREVVEPAIATVLPAPADQPATSRLSPDHSPPPWTGPLLASNPAPLSTGPAVAVDEAAPAVPLSQLTSPADAFAATVAVDMDLSGPASPASAVVKSCSGASAPSHTSNKATHGTSEDGYRVVPALVAYRVQTDNGDLPWSPNERPSTSPD